MEDLILLVCPVNLFVGVFPQTVGGILQTVGVIPQVVGVFRKRLINRIFTSSFCYVILSLTFE
jgi:uncharacterized protein with PQ loop repeat